MASTSTSEQQLRSDEDFARTLAAMDEYRGMLPCVMLVVSFVLIVLLVDGTSSRCGSLLTFFYFLFVDLDDMLIL